LLLLLLLGWQIADSAGFAVVVSRAGLGVVVDRPELLLPLVNMRFQVINLIGEIAHHGVVFLLQGALAGGTNAIMPSLHNHTLLFAELAQVLLFAIDLARKIGLLFLPGFGLGLYLERLFLVVAANGAIACLGLALTAPAHCPVDPDFV
jgi:hypothetical protein